jgi:hypothetical protein
LNRPPEPTASGGPAADFFGQLQQAAEGSGPVEVCRQLIAHFRQQRSYPELFEALKMAARLELGLPPVAIAADEELPEMLQERLEKRLLEACQEVGQGLLSSGRLSEGWMYMRPVGNRSVAAEALRQVQATSDNLEELLHLLVAEAIDIPRGTELSLEMRGICNTITMLEAVVARRGRPQQQAGVGVLVRFVHQQLLASVEADLQRRGWEVPQPLTLTSVLERYPDLLADGSYHLDTTHIASTVRFARVLDDLEGLRLADDLAAYGARLHSQYQYPSDPPFQDLYHASRMFFGVLLGRDIELGLGWFKQQAEQLDTAEVGTIAVETYVDLLARSERYLPALHYLLQRMPSDQRPVGIAPSLLELSQLAGDYRPMLAQATERHDLLGYAAALLQRGAVVAASSGEA